ncbi:hypothetical protein NHF46_19770 [Arthrobacter alpinus]|nr:hypothetical protein [Arthrobacter alpinus]
MTTSDAAAPTHISESHPANSLPAVSLPASQADSSASVQPPVAKKVPTERTHHGDTFVDNYEWLREKENPEVVAHLNAEQAYTDEITAGQEQLRTDIFNEIKNRTQETDLSVPSRKDDWWYYGRMVEGQAYGIQCRVRAESNGTLDDWTPRSLSPALTSPASKSSSMATSKPKASRSSIGGAAVTRDGNLYAYTVDNAGDELFTVRIKDLRTGELLEDTIENAFYGLAFSPMAPRCSTCLPMTPGAPTRSKPTYSAHP